jgi:hypothetical protein
MRVWMDGCEYQFTSYYRDPYPCTHLSRMNKTGNTNDAPRTLAPQIVEGVGASSSEGEGVDEDVDVGVGEGETEIEIWC